MKVNAFNVNVCSDNPERLIAFYTGPDATIDPVEENRQKQVVSLIRTNFLKRFESSVYAFECSLDRLLRKLLASGKA